MPARPGPVFRARYSAFLQLGLVVALVLALAGAGVGALTLDVRPPTRIGGAGVAPAIRTGDAYVARKPVAPKVREVAVKEAPRSPSVPSTPPAAAPVLRQVAETPAAKASGLATVGMTWAEDDRLGEDQVRMDVRTERHGRWSGWEKLEYHDDHGPDSGEDGDDPSKLRQGTEPTVVGHVDRVQVRTLTTIGRAPRDLRLVLIDPGADPVRKATPAIDTSRLSSTKKVERQQATHQGGDLSLSAMAIAPKPQIYSRAQWGADESIRDQSAPSYGTVQTGFVHHTVNANDYSPQDVPALLRGIYAYHVRARGWRDIGYNYLVDRFGQIWEGRYGGVDKAVVGAHTLGYNGVSFAMSAIGNFDIAQPPPAVAAAYARLFAWKLSLYNIPADATGLRVKGKVLNAINGHRDVGHTACPGKYLYAQIPAIRAAAAAIQRGQAPAPVPTPTPTPTPKPNPTPTPQPGPISPAAPGSLPARSSVLGGAWPDLVVRLRGSNEVQVVPTGGQFGFAAPVRSAGHWSGMDVVLAPGDLTGDGRGDLLVRSRRSGQVSVRAGDGAGHVGKPRARTSRLARFGWLAAAGDVDRDGHPDLVAGSGQKVYLVRGKAKARFAAPRLIASDWTGGPAVGAGRGRIAGVNARHRVIAATVSAKRLGRVVRSAVVVPPGGRLLGAGDLTGDGRPDLVVRAAKGQSRVYPASGKRWSTTPLGPFSALRGIVHPTLGNLAGGPTAEVVGYDTTGRLTVVGGNGRTNVGAPVSRGISLPGAGQILNVGDWNRDGHSDLVWRPSGGKYLFLRPGDGTGGFGPDVKMRAGMAKVGQLAAVGDVTGDGNPDLVGRTDAGEMVVYPGNGGTGFLGAVRAPSALRSFNQIGSALWNAAATGTSLTSASGTFVPNAAGVPGVGSTYDWAIGAGDADGDGIADLFVREAATGNLYLLPGTGSGFGERRFVAGGFGIYDLGS